MENTGPSQCRGRGSRGVTAWPGLAALLPQAAPGSVKEQSGTVRKAGERTPQPTPSTTPNTSQVT